MWICPLRGLSQERPRGSNTSCCAMGDPQGAAPTLLEEPPVSSSQSNGHAVSAVSTAGDGIRKLRIAVENKYNIKLPIESDVIPWLVQHAGFAHNRFMVGHDGKTPFARIRGRNFDKEICQFGECVYYRIPKIIIGPDLNKWDDQWALGVFLGIRPVSNEFFVGTSAGTIKCRTIRRRVASQRWDVSLLNSIRGVPWDHASDVDQGELPAERQLQPLPEGERVNEPEANEHDVINRSFKLFRSDVLERQRTHGDGFTPDCPGCIAVRSGSAAARNHSNMCRERYRNILFNSDKTKHRVVA